MELENKVKRIYINMDTTDLESLKFFHETCWEQYRKNNEVYPFPENFGDC